MLFLSLACTASWNPVDTRDVGDSEDPATSASPWHCGEVEGESDCDETDPDIGPNCPEVCDGVDNNCDDQIDEGLTATWYQDRDEDHWGDAAVATVACDPGVGWVLSGADCDDTNAAVHPQADEVCNELDDDCDGLVDPDAAIDAIRWYPDVDGDGYGDDRRPSPGCVAPEGYVSTPGDCADTDPAVHPEASEVAGNPTDENCDGVVAP